MPTLIQSYEKQLWVNQLKKTYTTLNEGFKRIAANEGCTNLECAGLKYEQSSFNSLLNRLDFSDERTKEKIVKEFKLENVFVGKPPSNSIYNYEIKKLSGDDLASFRDGFLADELHSLVGTTSSGEIIAFSDITIIVDINGLELPNISGRDIFWFAFGNYNGSTVVAPVGGSIFYSIMNNEEDEAYRIEQVNRSCSITSDDAAGDTCAEKIIMDGWKMNY